MDNIYMKGELLQLHTKNDEIVEGRFDNMSSDKSRISLYSVKEGEGFKGEGICHYYDSEVHTISKLTDTEDLQKKLTNHLKISQKNCEDTIKMLKKYVFINQIDNSFHDALEDLKQFGYIAVSTDGASLGRMCKMPFLVMSTPHQIYIFDIQVMQYHAFEAGLRSLLESEYPKKIVHDCRKLSDCLAHKHNIQLKSVFDTQVGDIIIMKNKLNRMPLEVKSLGQCLNSYLGLPLSTVEEKLEIVQCSERPLPVKMKETLAKNIAYIHCLSEVINSEMMLPFVRGVECYLENLRSCDDFKAWKISQTPVTQIPKEFKGTVEY